ncbi:tumor necrosis factor alpha-induced protein 8-like protein 2 isoform X1 [Apostichopus japonicus]|uniref:Tumor necrosis factor alpha-induced protein 8-like protein 2 n=2 Tax=Stichopus japonicus TaxID=307972 RepID=A0A219VGL3_STIJA|nr:tumor necrosis factor alpha-induced protein 8-like protein 2 [Apostichopus japonicus]
MENSQSSDEDVAEGNAQIDSKSFGLKAQKKILGKMASSKKVTKAFIDDEMAALLDNVYRLCKVYSGNKKDADKIMKSIIKTTIKIGILYRNNQFSQEEMALAERFKSKFRSTILTFISFHEVPFTFDKNHMVSMLTDCQDILVLLVKRHLTEKSLNRIKSVFHYFSDGQLQDMVFEPDTPLQPQIVKIINQLNKLIDDKVI